MRKKIAIEHNLENVAQHLMSEGYKVDKYDDTQIGQLRNGDTYDAIVISGGNKDFMGVSDTSTKTTVINAEGMTPEQVIDEIREIEK